jgi:hypothetical protein
VSECGAAAAEEVEEDEEEEDKEEGEGSWLICVLSREPTYCV